MKASAILQHRFVCEVGVKGKESIIMKLSRREFIKKAAVTAAAAGLLVGCGGGPSVYDPSNNDGPVPNGAPEPTPTQEPPYNADVLTGLERESGAKDSRIIGVMINNMADSSSNDARPHRGIGEAKILIECKVEGGITRFCALFNDTAAIPELGPIRSGRDQFLQLIMPWQALYYHDGESVFCTKYIKDWEYWDLNIGGKSYFNTPTHTHMSHRDKRGRNVQTEHTEFVSGEEIQKAIDKANIDMTRKYNSTFFKFADYRYGESVTLDNGSSATSITIRHSPRYRTYFDYDESTQQYKMKMYHHAHKAVEDTIDENTGKQLSFNNVIVLFAPMAAYPGDSHDIQKVDYAYGGVGYYFTNGRCREIGWQKGGPNNVLALYDYDTDPYEMLTVNCGKSYLTMVDLDEAEKFSFEGVDETPVADDLSDAGEAPAGGEADDVNESEEAAKNVNTN